MRKSVFPTRFPSVRSNDPRSVDYAIGDQAEKELRDYGSIVLADITSVRPKLIIALGKSAVSLFGASTTIENDRRQVLCFQHMPVRITYHPGFVLRFGGRGSRLWRTAVRDLRTYWETGEIIFFYR